MPTLTTVVQDVCAASQALVLIGTNTLDTYQTYSTSPEMKPSCTDSDILFHLLMPNVLILGRFG